MKLSFMGGGGGGVLRKGSDGWFPLSRCGLKHLNCPCCCVSVSSGEGVRRMFASKSLYKVCKLQIGRAEKF